MTDLARAPGPKGHLLLGSLPDFNRDILGFFEQLQKAHGDMIRLRLVNMVAHVLCHPRLAEEALITNAENIVKYSQVKPQRGLALAIGNGLIMSYGELWRRQRQLMNPVFRPRSVEATTETVLACGEQLAARFQLHAHSGAPIDVWREARRTALQTAVATLFGAPATDDFTDLEEVLTVILRYCFQSEKNPLMPPPNWPTRRNREFHAALAALDAYVHSLIDKRTGMPRQKADLLGLLLDAVDETTGQPLSAKQVRDEAVTMLGAGHETSASSLTWGLVQLARHPSIVQKIREELAAVVGNESLNFSHFRRLRYLHAVVQETLRLCSPAPIIRRAALRDTTIGGYPVPKGSMLFISVYNIHRHPEFWDDAATFEPERFLEAGAAQRPRCSYLPFGAGERFCIGSNFASLELAVFIAKVVGRFDLRLSKSGPIGSEVAVSMRPTEPVYMHVAKIHPIAGAPTSQYG